jgi:septal ring factor EnvC (AmiA/AmiB activator)
LLRGHLGKSGKYYPTYHCDKRGHYFRIPKHELRATVAKFIGSLRISQDHIDNFIAVIEADYWHKHQQSLKNNLQTLDDHIKSLQLEVIDIASKIKFVSSQSTIKYIEEDIMRIAKQIKDLEDEKEKR